VCCANGETNLSQEQNCRPCFSQTDDHHRGGSSTLIDRDPHLHLAQHHVHGSELSADDKAVITALFCPSCDQHLFVAADAAFKQQIAAGMPVLPSEVPILANRQPIFFVAARLHLLLISSQLCNLIRRRESLGGTVVCHYTATIHWCLRVLVYALAGLKYKLPMSVWHVQAAKMLWEEDAREDEGRSWL